MWRITNPGRLAAMWRSTTQFAGMLRVTRESTIAIGALCGVLLACIFLVGFSLVVRADAARQVSDQRDLLVRLEGARPGSGARAPDLSAPPSAFLEAATEGVAAAKLQAYLTSVIASQQATLLSSSVEAAGRPETADSIRIQASTALNLNALQAILYKFETETPYVFVDALTVQPQGGSAQVAPNEPTLRVTMTLRALWKKGGS